GGGRARVAPLGGRRRGLAERRRPAGDPLRAPPRRQPRGAARPARLSAVTPLGAPGRRLLARRDRRPERLRVDAPPARAVEPRRPGSAPARLPRLVHPSDRARAPPHSASITCLTSTAPSTRARRGAPTAPRPGGRSV